MRTAGMASMVASVLMLGAAAALSGCQPKSPNPSGSGASPQGVRWAVFTDPNAHAFTLEAPNAWNVEGGSLAVSAADVRVGVKATSPDGGVELFVGDASVPIFMVPNPTLAMAGMRPGATYAGNGGSALIEPYLTGAAFAADWGPKRLSRDCSNVRLIGSRELPQASQRLDAAYESGGVMVSLAAGEATFSCTGADGKPRKGYVIAATELDQTQGLSYWKVQFLSGYLATPDREADAARLLSVMAGSFRIDPTWQAKNNALNANIAGITAQAGAAEAQSISESFNDYMATTERTNRNFANVQRGLAIYQDPVDGPRTLENYPHQWRMPDGSHQGTNSANPPVPGAQELTKAQGQP